MQSINNKREPFLRNIVVFCVFLFAGCGGGGGDVSSVTQTSPAYNGSTGKMLIDELNAAEVAIGAVDGGIRGNVFDGFTALTESAGSYDAQNLSVLLLVDMMEEAVFLLKENSQSLDRSITTVHTRQETVEGRCGGHGTGSFSLDDVTGEFWGDLLFSDYCESNVALNGKTSFSGTTNPSTGEFVSFSFDFNSLQGSDSSATFFIDGTAFMDPTARGAAITMNVFLQDSQSSDVFWLNDYHLEVVNGLSTMAINVSGKYYHPAHGYVTLSTQQDLLLDVNDMVPLSGVLLAIGKNGSAGGPTMAKLTCSSDGQFQAEADTDGDGVYDWDSETLFWDEF